MGLAIDHCVVHSGTVLYGPMLNHGTRVQDRTVGLAIDQCVVHSGIAQCVVHSGIVLYGPMHAVPWYKSS